MENLNKIKDKKELEKKYKNGTPPNYSELRGIYKITMLTGFLPDLSRFGHIKIFYPIHPPLINKTTGKITEIIIGYNSFNYQFKWGDFRVENDQSSQETIINYNLETNWFSKRIRDTVVTIIPTQLYLGKFHYVIFGKPRFIGYFMMEK